VPSKLKTIKRSHVGILDGIFGVRAGLEEPVGGQRCRHSDTGDRPGTAAHRRTHCARDGQTACYGISDIERDHWLSAEEAMDYGLVGRIIKERQAL